MQRQFIFRLKKTITIALALSLFACAGVSDSDNDGIEDDADLCANTPSGTPVDATGCAVPDPDPEPVDSDNDGVIDSEDLCALTPQDAIADLQGCSPTQRDTDNDSISDAQDQCPNTPAGSAVAADGCVPVIAPKTGEQWFSEQCRDCHVPTKEPAPMKRVIDFPRYATKAALTQTTATTMPLFRVNDCGVECAAAITDYLWALNDLREQDETQPSKPVAEHAHNATGLIEAEHYHRYSDTSPDSNEGNCNNTSEFGKGVDLNRTFGNEPAGCYVGYIAADEWLEYDLGVEYGGVFDFAFRLASDEENKKIEVSIDGELLGVLEAPGQGWGKYSNILLKDIRLNRGGHVLRVRMVTDGLDINNFSIEQTLVRPINLTTLSGEEINTLVCASCHGETGTEGSLAYAGIRFVDELGALKFTQDTLREKITQDMPFKDPAYCGEACASKLVEYFWQANNLGDITPVNCQAGGAQLQRNAPLRRLSRTQLSQLLVDSFEPLALDMNAIMALIPADVSVAGFPNNAGIAADEAYFAELIKVAEIIGEAASNNRAALLGGCALNDEACRNTFVSHYGEVLFRQPLSNNQKARLLAVFDQVAADQARPIAFKALVMAMVLDVQTLYHTEQSVATRQMLSSMELLTKMSLFLWDQAPDRTLINTVKNTPLISRDAVVTLANTMLDDKRAQKGLRYFYTGWLNLNPFGDFGLEGQRYENSGLVSELERFVSYLTLERNGTFADLLTDKTAFIAPGYGALYQVAEGNPNNDGYSQVTLGGERAGLLTRSAYLRSADNNANVTSITLRGLKLRESILCQHVEPPSAAVQNEFPKKDIDSDALSPIDFFTEVHLSAEGCAGCHKFMDPIGFAFESFDGFGVARQQYADGSVIEYQGQTFIQEMNGQASDIVGAFSDVADLSRKVATSERAQKCFVKQWYRNTFTRNLSREDSCAYEEITQAFSDENYSLKGLIVALISSDAFIYRNPETAPE